MKKKLFIMMLALMVGISAIACGSNDDDLSDADNNTQIEDTENGESTPEEDDDVDVPNDPAKDPATKPDTKPENTPSKPDSKPNTGGQGSGSTTELKGSFEDIISGLYKTAGIELNTGTTTLTAENMAYYLGIDNIKIKQGLASEPLMSSVAHSVVLIELESGQDVSKIKTNIKNNVDGYKWVCVGVEPENILVENIGNYVLLVMDEDAKNIMDAFKALAK